MPHCRILWFALIVALTILGANPCHAAEPGLMTITLADLERDVDIPLDAPWRYQLGDDLAWAGVDVDDSAWPLTKTNLTADGQPPDFDGKAWFRLRLRIADNVASEDFALRVRALGPYEAFLDGERIIAFEHSAAVEFLPAHLGIRLRPGATHVLAIRLITPGWRTFRASGVGVGVEVAMSSLRTARVSAFRSQVLYQEVQGGLIGAALALGILHLLMLLFYPAQRNNLYFATLSFSFVATHGLSQVIFVVDVASDFGLVMFGFKVAMLCFAAASVQTFHALLGNPTPKFFRALWASVAALTMASVWLPLEVAFLLNVVGTAECVRVTIMGVIRKRQNAPLVALGCALFVSGTMYAALRFLLVRSTDQSTAPAWGTVAMLLCISATLAREFAKGKRAEIEKSQLHAKQAELVQSEKMAALGLLVAGIAHEVNTPLAAIQSAGASLAAANNKLDRWITKNVPNENIDRKLERTLGVVRDSTDIVGTATERVNDVIQRLKDFAKLDQAEEQRSNLNELVTTTVATIQHELSSIKLDTVFGELPPVLCVPRQINQVLVNLLLNAAAAVREGGDITVTTKHVGDQVLIEVTDTGAGIEDKHLAKIFDPGFTTQGVGVGAGLGLAIAHQIVSDHDGTIEVTSKLAEGSTFTVKLPA